jgi:hypothetical protein
MSTFSYRLDSIDLFDRVNLAHCAMRRARSHVFGNDDTFRSEIETCRLWNNYRCYNSPFVSYKENL